LATNDPDDRGAVVLLRPVPPPLVGSAAGWIVRITMRDALFSRILVHLIRFHFRVLQRRPIEAGSSLRLPLMSQFQEMSAAATQLACQLRCGYALGETPDDEDQHRGAIVGPLEHGPGPGVEDPSARRAAIVEDGFSVVTMDNEPLLGLTAGAMQSLGVEEVEEELIAGVLIQEGLDREVHDSVSSTAQEHLP
jgi:hypothetical protein